MNLFYFHSHPARAAGRAWSVVLIIAAHIEQTAAGAGGDSKYPGNVHRSLRISRVCVVRKKS